MENIQSKPLNCINDMPPGFKSNDEFNKKIRQHLQEIEEKLRKMEYENLEKKPTSYEESVLLRNMHI